MVYGPGRQGKRPVAGFPMTPRDSSGGTSPSFRRISGLVLGDFDGDPQMEIFFTQGWSVTVVDGDGTEITSSSYSSNDPTFSGDGVLINTPALGDIDDDGKLELIATNSIARAWDLKDATSQADWPLFRRDAANHARVPRQAAVAASPEKLVIFHDLDDPGPIQGAFVLRIPYGGPVSWNGSTPNNLSLAQSSGLLYPDQYTVVLVRVKSAGLKAGVQNVGQVDIEAYADGQESDPIYLSVPVTVHLGEFDPVWMPIIHRW